MKKIEDFREATEPQSPYIIYMCIGRWLTLLGYRFGSLISVGISVILGIKMTWMLETFLFLLMAIASIASFYHCFEAKEP